MGAECVCVVTVPFSVQRVVYVVKLVTGTDVVYTEKDAVVTAIDELLPYCGMLTEEELLAKLEVP